MENKRDKARPPGSRTDPGRGCDRRAQRGKRSPESRPPGGQFVRQRGEKSGGLLALLQKAKDKGIPIKEVDPRKLDHLCAGANHQGVVAPGGGEGIRQRGGHLRPGGRERGAPLPAGVRRAGRPPQPGGGNPHGGVRRRPRGGDPQAPQRGTDTGRWARPPPGRWSTCRWPGCRTWPALSRN